tara:strand:- start:86 stop:1057 length:972 start_codon:yes stop_codon:yes gene_type:complete
MVLFLDKKEQVIEFELTPHGRYLVSQGKLDPKYYAFYDDDVLYDSNYQTGSAESPHPAPLALEPQNDISTRVKDTPRIGVITNFTEKLNTNQGNAEPTLLANEFAQDNKAYTIPFQRPIGTNSAWKNYAPAWRVSAISGSNQFDNYYAYAMKSSDPRSPDDIIVSNTPKISGTLRYDYVSMNEQAWNPETNQYEEKESHTLLKNERFVLDISELNSFYNMNGNFDIEVYKVREGGEERIQKLHFINEATPAGSELVAQTNPLFFAQNLAGTEETLEETFQILDEDYVEYYLSIRVDDEIEDPLPMGDSIYGPQQRIPTDNDKC